MIHSPPFKYFTYSLFVDFVISVSAAYVFTGSTHCSYTLLFILASLHKELLVVCRMLSILNLFFAGFHKSGFLCLFLFRIPSIYVRRLILLLSMLLLIIKLVMNLVFWRFITRPTLCLFQYLQLDILQTISYQDNIVGESKMIEIVPIDIYTLAVYPIVWKHILRLPWKISVSPCLISRLTLYLLVY